MKTKLSSFVNPEILEDITEFLIERFYKKRAKEYIKFLLESRELAEDEGDEQTRDYVQGCLDDLLSEHGNNGNTSVKYKEGVNEGRTFRERLSLTERDIKRAFNSYYKSKKDKPHKSKIGGEREKLLDICRKASSFGIKRIANKTARNRRISFNIDGKDVYVLDFTKFRMMRVGVFDRYKSLMEKYYGKCVFNATDYSPETIDKAIAKGRIVRDRGCELAATLNMHKTLMDQFCGDPFYQIKKGTYQDPMVLVYSKSNLKEVKKVRSTYRFIGRPMNALRAIITLHLPAKRRIVLDGLERRINESANESQKAADLERAEFVTSS